MASRKKSTTSTKRSTSKPTDTGLSPEAEALLEAGGWENITGGAGEPWAEGVTVQGILVGIKDSHFTQDDGEHAKLVDVRTSNGVRTMRCPAILHSRLEGCVPGDVVYIGCKGKVRTGAGRLAWAFEVLVKRAQASLDV